MLAYCGYIGMVKHAKMIFQRVLWWVTLIFEIIIKRAALSQNGTQYHKTGHFFICMAHAGFCSPHACPGHTLCKPHAHPVHAPLQPGLTLCKPHPRPIHSPCTPLHAQCKEEVVLGPMLLFSDLTSIEMELTCKKLGPNLKNWMRFLELEIWLNWDITSPRITRIAIASSIFEIQVSWLYDAFRRNKYVRLEEGKS